MRTDICVEPQLQQLTGETLQSSTLTGNEVPLDICERCFWQIGEGAFFDIMVFNPNAKAKRCVKRTSQKLTNLMEKKEEVVQWAYS